MPYKLKDRNKWRGAVMVDGNRVVKDFSSKKDARAWEEAEKERLRNPGIPKTQEDTGFVLLVNDYLDYCQDRYVDKTYEEKKYILNLFGDFLGQDFSIINITEKQIIDYLSSVKQRISANAANVHRKNLLAFWSWLRKYYGIKHNPVLLVDKFPHDVQIQYTPPEADVLKVLAAAKGQDQIILETYVHTGARKSEIFRLTWIDVNFEKKQIRLGTRKTRDGSMSYTWLPLNDYLAGRLLWLFKNRKFKESPFVFVVDHPGHADHGRPYKYRDRFMLTLCKRADVKPFGFHALRRFSASLLADKFKQSMPTIQKILRHSKITTTERYVQSIEDGQKMAMDALSNWAIQCQKTSSDNQAEATSKKTF